MTSTSDDIEGAFPSHLTLAEMVSLVPPVPQAVVSRVAQTPYGQGNPDWATSVWGVPQMITALVLLERSPAGRAWNVQLDAIPSGFTATDTRYILGCEIVKFKRAAGCVEWFFKRSIVSESAPMATVTWADRFTLLGTGWYGIAYSCNAISRMLYAAQGFQQSPNITTVNARFEAMERKISELEARITTLGVHGSRVPTVTCLMHLFAIDTMFTVSTTDNPSTTDPDVVCPTSRSGRGPGGIHAAGAAAYTFCPRLTYSSIAAHTDRLCDLSLDAQNWFFHQLDSRTVWVRVTDPDSEDNHISWGQFPGAVEMGKNVIFMYGSHRFW